jgi:aminoglycoside/choline kinase family phosphotransferase
MNIQKATRLYEHWLGQQLELIRADIRHKHQLMASEPFPFFRATFYRWIQLWPEACTDLADAPVVLAVGDLHVENFGTWRDQEGRLIWGVNDFDEAFPLPWTNDLVRLATSAHLAVQSDHLSIGRREACDSILAGYEQALVAGGMPFVLAEKHGWLRNALLGKLRDPVRFWKKLDSLPTWQSSIPRDARIGLQHLLPQPSLKGRTVHRIAGLGSLGHQRFVTLSDWRGGQIAREAKALAPSACYMALAQAENAKIYCQDIIDNAVRVPDPFVGVHGKWIVRRLAPDCTRVELADLPEGHDESTLLHAMGYETANIHLGTKGAQRAIAHDLNKRPKGWLHRAVKRMARSVTADWADWRAVVHEA